MPNIDKAQYLLQWNNNTSVSFYFNPTYSIPLCFILYHQSKHYVKEDITNKAGKMG